MRQLKYITSYKTFISVLEDYPELLEGCRTTLEAARQAATKDYETPATELEGGDVGIIHGDFWTGK